MKLAPQRPIVPSDYLAGGKSTEISNAIALIPKLNKYIDYLEAQREDWMMGMRKIVTMPECESAREIDGGGRNFFDIVEDAIKGL